MERRYSALRITSTIYKIFGFLTLILTVLGAIGACIALTVGGSIASDLGLPGAESGTAAVAGILAAVFVLIFGGLTAVSLIGTAELFDLLIALEENTRATRRLMEAERRETVTPPAFTPSLTPRPTPPFTPPAPGAPLPPTTP